MRAPPNSTAMCMRKACLAAAIASCASTPTSCIWTWRSNWPLQRAMCAWTGAATASAATACAPISRTTACSWPPRCTVYCCTDKPLAALVSMTALWHGANAWAMQTPSDPPPCNEPLCYTASKLEAERNRIVLYDIDIVDTTRGVSHIKADRAEATGLDLGSSQWLLTGNVQVFMPQGELHADKATVQFASKRIQSMTAEGAPAVFEH